MEFKTSGEFDISGVLDLINVVVLADGSPVVCAVEMETGAQHVFYGSPITSESVSSSIHIIPELALSCIWSSSRSGVKQTPLRSNNVGSAFATRAAFGKVHVHIHNVEASMLTTLELSSSVEGTNETASMTCTLVDTVSAAGATTVECATVTLLEGLYFPDGLVLLKPPAGGAQQGSNTVLQLYLNHSLLARAEVDFPHDVGLQTVTSIQASPDFKGIYMSTDTGSRFYGALDLQPKSAILRVCFDMLQSIEVSDESTDWQPNTAAAAFELRRACLATADVGSDWDVFAAVCVSLFRQDTNLDAEHVEATPWVSMLQSIEHSQYVVNGPRNVLIYSDHCLRLADFLILCAFQTPPYLNLANLGAL